jgi:hypothetical protein
MNTLDLTTRVLRNPDEIANTDDPHILARLAPPLLFLACGGAALLGIAAGSTSGPIQATFAAVKTPALFLVPPLVVLPLVYTAAEAAGTKVQFSRLAIATLAGLARTGLLAAAAAPLLWLPFSLGTDYHLSVLLFVATFGVVMLPALGLIVRALPAGGSLRLPAMLGTTVLLALVTAQTGWMLRPFVARPAADVTFLRPVEADIFSSLGATTRSAQGDYNRDWQPESSGRWKSR